eukprot:scpid104501/ scgid14696/ 
MYDLVRSLSCFDPKEILEKPEVCCRRVERVLHAFQEASVLLEDECERAHTQYRKFVVEAAAHPSFQGFESGDTRIDALLCDFMAQRKDFEQLWHLTKMVLLLSHGQASVERGFSINKEASTDNMKEHTLVAQRAIKDHILFVGGVRNVALSKELLKAAGIQKTKTMAVNPCDFLN